MFDLADDWLWRIGEQMFGLKREEIQADKKVAKKYVKLLVDNFKYINEGLDTKINKIISELESKHGRLL